MMRLPPFDYRRARSIDEAVALRVEHGGMYVAGGTDLYPNMKRRHQTPATVIDLMPVRELRSIEAVSRSIEIGACARLSEVARHPALQGYGALLQAVRSISTPLLRNMGTLGGNVLLDTRCNYYNQSEEWRRAVNFCMKKDGDVCWVAPGSSRCWAVQSSDTVPVLVALDARYRLVGPQGERTVAAGDFYRDDGIQYLHKAGDELLTHVVLPPMDGSDMAFRKLRRRGAFDFPVLNVAVWVRWVNGVVDEARIVVGAVGSAPLRVPEAESQVRGTHLDSTTCAAAAEAAYRPAKPLDNTDFAYAWRKQMVRKFVREALEEVGRRHQGTN
ncbi:MAG TPA: FAD binding domain-containing protein [Candidatus Xenobia bacterium]|jgi:4-hydroxybenzoyl-CoA reductase subunit beta